MATPSIDCDPSGAAEAELDEELAFHIERETAKLMRSGLPLEEARRRARLAIGGPSQSKEEVRDEWIWRWCRDLAQDARYAFRALRQSPTFTAVAVLSLALGIGANTAIFSILNAVAMKPLPVRDPARLGHLFRTGDNSFTYAVWKQIRDRQDVFSSTLAYCEMTFDLADGGEKRPAQGLYVSGDYFRTLGVPALIGRVLTPDDDRRGVTPVAVLSYGFWQRAYGGDPHIAGRTIRLDGHLFQVVGVTPASFFGLDVGDTFDVIVPLTSEALIDADEAALDNRGMWWLTIIGRLKPGVSHPQAAARLRVLSPAIFQAAMGSTYAHEHQRGFLANRLDLKPAAGLSQLRDRYGVSLLVLMGIVGLVLLIACVNIANLLLARAGARQREIAIRLAVGAGRGRLVRQLLTESVVLSLAGAACGAVLARWGGPAIVALISEPGQSRFLDLSPDVRVLAFTAGAAILTGILFGLAPALKATGTTTSEALKQGARGLTERRGPWSLGRLLVVAQVALSLLLLVGAGLFVGTLRNLLRQDLGFRSERILLVEPDLRAGKYSRQRVSQAAEELLARLRAIPGVEAASRAAVTPIERGSWQWDVKVDAAGGGRKSVHAYFNLVSPGYFETLRAPVLRGRDFAEAGDITTRGKEEGFAKFQEQMVNSLKERLRNREAFFLVPGNHDVRWGLDPTKPNYFDLKFESFSRLTREIGAIGALVPRGSLRPDSEPIAFAEGEPLYVDRVKRFVVLCVNSSIRCGEVNAALRKAFSSPFKAALAGVRAAAKELPRSGRSNTNLRHLKVNLQDCLSVVEEQTLFDIPHITHPQLERLAARLTTAKTELEPDWSSYTKIALLHHHIVPFECQVPEYKAFAGTADAANLLDLLSDFGFQLVLTGHKHQPYIQEMSFGGSPLLIAGGATVGGQPVSGSFQGIRHIEFRPRDSVVRVANLHCDWHGAMVSQVREQIEASEEHALDRPPSRKRTYFPDDRIESAIQRQLYDWAFYRTDLVFEIDARELSPKRTLTLKTDLSYMLVNRTNSKCRCEIRFSYDPDNGEIVLAEFNGKAYDLSVRDYFDSRGLRLWRELEAGQTGRIHIIATEMWRIPNSVLFTSFQPATDLKVVLRSEAPNVSFDLVPLYRLDEEWSPASESGAKVVRFRGSVLPNQGINLVWKTDETEALPSTRASASDRLPVK